MSRFFVILSLSCACPSFAAGPKGFSEADYDLALKHFSDGGYMSFRLDAAGGGAQPMVLVLMRHDRLGKISEVLLGSAIFGQDGTLDSASKVLELNRAGYATLRTFLRKFAAGVADGKFAAIKLKTIGDDGAKLPIAGAQELSRDQLLELAGDKANDETTEPAKPSGEPTPKYVAPKNRTWVDITGKHRTVARFLELKDGRVRLKKTDGKTISLPFEQLSEADRQYVNAFVAAEKQPEIGPNSTNQPAAEGEPSKKDDIAAGPPKKGRSWSNVNNAEVNGEKRVAGKRFAIWPTNDEILKIEGGKLTLRLQWQVAAGQEPPGEPKEDAINLHLYLVSKTVRALRGQAVKLDVGANQGEVERTESLDVDVPTGDVYAYFSRDTLELAKAKVVSTPLSNIVRIKVDGK